MDLGAEAFAVADDPEAPGRALSILEAAGGALLAADASPELVAGRLIHLSALYMWSRVDAELGAGLGGQAAAHLSWLGPRAEDNGTSQTVLLRAARVIGALAFPALPGSREIWSTEISALPRALVAMTGSDGGPREAPARVARALWAAHLSFAWAAAAGIARPTAAAGPLVAGALALCQIAGPAGILPGPAIPALLPLGPAPLPWTLRRLCGALGLDQGPFPPGDDPACTLLAGSCPAGDELPPLEKRWELRAWRETGAAVAFREVRGASCRVWAHGPGGAIQVDLGPSLVLAFEGEDGTLRRARVDGHELRIELGALTVQARQSRLIFEGPGTAIGRIRLGSDWSFNPDGEGFLGRSGLQTLAIQPDERWRWTLSPSLTEGSPTLRGEGPPHDDLRVGFELR